MSGSHAFGPLDQLGYLVAGWGVSRLSVVPSSRQQVSSVCMPGQRAEGATIFLWAGATEWGGTCSRL
eukprot:2113803-Amphidinium_carterae.1